MSFTCTIHQAADGDWRGFHQSEELGRIDVSAASRQAAIDKLKGEIRYRLELCPCTAETYQHIQIELVPMER